MNCGSSRRGRAGDAELQRQPHQLALEGAQHLPGSPARRPAAAPSLEAPVGRRLPAGLARRPLGCLLGGADLALQHLLDLGDGLVEEGGWAVDHPARGQLGDLVADLRQRRALAARQGLGELGAAGEAGLELEQRLQVLGQRQLAQVLAHQHHRRLVPEALAEALGGLELGGVLVHQRLGPGVGLEPERPHGPRHGQHQHNEQRRPRPAHGHPRNPLEPTAHQGAEIRGRNSMRRQDPRP